MVIAPATTYGSPRALQMDKASVDRIDNHKGYVPGNIQFVCMIANFAKNVFSESDLLMFCSAVAKHQELIEFAA